MRFTPQDGPQRRQPHQPVSLEGLVTQLPPVSVQYSTLLNTIDRQDGTRDELFLERASFPHQPDAVFLISSTLHNPQLEPSRQVLFALVPSENAPAWVDELARRFTLSPHHDEFCSYFKSNCAAQVFVERVPPENSSARTR